MQYAVRAASLPDIPSIRSIANAVWPVTYREILSPEQISYMLELFYSVRALTEQMKTRGHHFVLAAIGDEQPVGFASFSVNGEAAQVHKLYVLPQTQGTGAGAALLSHCEEEAARAGADVVHLNVNRHNRAKTFYDRHGYRVLFEEDIDIGNGFFMNDYRMEKRLDRGAEV